MEPVDLEQVAARVQAVRPNMADTRDETRDETQDETRQESPPRAHGRLAELASWWTRVAGSPAAGALPAAPARVRQLWLSAPVTLAPATHAHVTVTNPAIPETVPEAVDAGAATADEAADNGVQLLLLSLPGPPSGATRPGGPADVLAAHLLGVDPVRALGWPAAAGLGDQEWTAAVRDLRDGLRAVRGQTGARPAGLLDALGDPRLAAATALLLQSAARRTPVLLDGSGAAAAALLGYRACRRAVGWWQAAHSAGTGLHERTLEELGLEPWHRLGIRAEDGTGARLGLALLEAALARG